MTTKTIETRKLVTIAVFSALAYIVSFFSIPVAGFLSFELKDCIIAIAGFTFGPLAAFCCALISAFAEFITFSKTGIIGCAMNLVSSATFACTAAFFYKHQRNIKGAVLGLSISCIVLTIVMLAWNYILTPLYTKVPREQVAGMLLPILLPFNLSKGIVNAAATIFLYKPVVNVLRQFKLVKPSSSKKPYKINWGLLAVVLFFVGTAIVTLSLLGGDNDKKAPSKDASETEVNQTEKSNPENSSDNNSLNSSSESSESNFETISHEKAKEILDSGEPVVILDIRKSEEYAAGHLEKAIPFYVEGDQVNENAKMFVEQLVLRKDQYIIVYCGSANNSSAVSKVLADAGYVNVKDLGDISGWQYGFVTK